MDEIKTILTGVEDIKAALSDLKDKQTADSDEGNAQKIETITHALDIIEDAAENIVA